MPQLTINRLISVGVITNYHCVSKCGASTIAAPTARRTIWMKDHFPAHRRPWLPLRAHPGREPLLQPEKLAACHQKHYGKRQRRMPAWTKSSRCAGCSNG